MIWILSLIDSLIFNLAIKTAKSQNETSIETKSGYYAFDLKFAVYIKIENFKIADAPEAISFDYSNLDVGNKLSQFGKFCFYL